MGIALVEVKMKRDQPQTPDAWLDEIVLAIADARGKTPAGDLTGDPIDDANLFHLAPHICLKFRGLDSSDEELREKVTEGALANYVANSDLHGLETRPLMAFALCYLTSHFVLELIDESEAEQALAYCEEHLD